MKQQVIGILAHVDAGKTTLAESLLYNAGVIRAQGKVDKGNTVMDTHSIEKQRGITVFSSQAVFTCGDICIYLLDTPGHVDFSAETERTLQVLDAAVLVISALDGVQSHTKTLWKLLEIYNVPTFIFVTKMDFGRNDKEKLLKNLQNELSDDVVDFSAENSNRDESLASLHEKLLNKYLDGEKITDNDIAELVAYRKAFPCIFGSGLTGENTDKLIENIERYTINKRYPTVIGGRCFKITNEGDNRVTHIKLTGGEIHPKDCINDEKINQIRIYTGNKYVTSDKAVAGQICALTGLNKVKSGDGFGYEDNIIQSYLEPTLKYRIALPPQTDADLMLPKLKKLEDEDPKLHFTVDKFNKDIYCSLMGKVQTEVIRSLVKERFDVDVSFDNGKVIYKETICDSVEGVGHYEPLRHYAEVHLLLEPLKRGSGIVVTSRCSEDLLSRNWQRLIMTHINEKLHLGVLTGSPITDIKITLMSGRAHPKHTEGGDFRQATYRAIRQGLMKAKSVLLEPYVSFTIEIPCENIGRAISDIKLKGGELLSPMTNGDTSIIKGKGPAVAFSNYSQDVAAYTGGNGRFISIPIGYDECRDSENVISTLEYNPLADLDNTPDSVFCAHGAGFNVGYNEVENYMHLESCLKQKTAMPLVNKRNFHIDDKELNAILEREFGKPKWERYRDRSFKAPQPQEEKEVELKHSKTYLIVDGYNYIFANEELNEIAKSNLENARLKLQDSLCNYSGFTGNEVVLVFDAYKVSGNNGKKYDYNNIHIVFTSERELADVYIEKLIRDIGKNEKVKVVSSDGLIQLSAVRFGVLRMPVREFEIELEETKALISEKISI